MSGQLVTRRVVMDEVRRLDPSLSESDPAFLAASVLIACLLLGRSAVPLIARTLNEPQRTIKPLMQRLRANGVVGRRYLHVEWDDPETGGIAFWMDVSVALGHVERADA